MMLNTLLNRCYRFKGFVYESARLGDEGQKLIEIEMRSRRGSRPYCSGCGKLMAFVKRQPDLLGRQVGDWPSNCANVVHDWRVAIQRQLQADSIVQKSLCSD